MDTRSNKAPSPGDHPLYHSLWPLQVMHILDKRGHPTSAWDFAESAARPTRVAILDTSIAVDHPNLADSVNRALTLDLVSTRLGAFPFVEGTIGEIPDNGILSASNDRDQGAYSEHFNSLVAEFAIRLGTGSDALLGGVRPAQDPAFSTHGTAIAGLVCGRPKRLADVARADGTRGEVVLPFAGVDPSCEIVPVFTGFDPDPEQMILALLYAEIIDADVILLPRDFGDPGRTVPVLDSTEGEGPWTGYPVELFERERRLWDDLAKLVVEVSQSRPIVCAAGNSGDENVIYPACLAAPDNGIIAVGAVNANGLMAGYSSYGTPVTVAFPSNDGERYDREGMRLDPRDLDTPDRRLGREDLPETPFSIHDVISTDVPGNFGYNTSIYGDRRSDLEADPETDSIPRSVRELGSFYCRFGGTSAASALAAGFIALGYSRDVISRRGCGKTAKQWLIERSHTVTENEPPVPSWLDAAPVFPPPTYTIGHDSLVDAAEPVVT